MFTIDACTQDQLECLREAYFYGDDSDHNELFHLGIWGPSPVPDWMLFRDYSGVMFTEEDFAV